MNETNQDKRVFEVPFGRWMAERSFSRSFCLIYGRSREIDNDQKRRLWQMIQEETGFIIRTADQIFDSGSQRRNRILNVFGRVQDRLKFKYLHVEPIQIFAYLTRDELRLRDEDVAQLRNWGFDIEDWLQGRRLEVGAKYASVESMTRALGLPLPE